MDENIEDYGRPHARQVQGSLKNLLLGGLELLEEEVKAIESSVHNQLSVFVSKV
jgi:hypothetical protein